MSKSQKSINLTKKSAMGKTTKPTVKEPIPSFGSVIKEINSILENISDHDLNLQGYSDATFKIQIKKNKDNSFNVRLFDIDDDEYQLSSKNFEFAHQT